MLMFLLALSLAFFHVPINGTPLNVTIDDTSSRISYAGNWEASSTHLSGLDYGGSHTLSSDNAASATFKFNGVAVYYLSPRWPYAVSTRLSLDGNTPVLVNLTDPNASPTPAGGSESAPYSVLWSATGLTNMSHTVVATYGNYIIVDGFIYTVDDGSTASSFSSSSSATSTSSSTSSFASSSKSSTATLAASSGGTSTLPSKTNFRLALGLGTALGLAAVIVVSVILFYLFRSRRRRRRPAQPTRASDVLDDWEAVPQWYSPRPTAPPPGHYTAVSTGESHHDTPSMSESSRPLIGGYPTSTPISSLQERSGSEYRDAPSTSSPYNSSAPSRSEGSSARSRPRNLPELPPGAMSAAPDGYMNAPLDDLASGSPALSHAASSQMRLSPQRGRAHISNPPAYSES